MTSADAPRRRVVIGDLQQIYRVVRALYIPLVHGLLRAHAEACDDLRAAYEFAEPLCIPSSLEEMLDAIGAADVVGFSTYVWNECNSHALARAVRERLPEALIVFGGPQIPRTPSDYLERHPWVDLCVHGEGEAAFSAILRERLRPSPSWEDVPGVSFRCGQAQRWSVAARVPVSLDVASPFTLGHFDAFVERAHAAGYRPVASLETSRGCPYVCAFCNWGMATGTKPRFRPLERVLEEFDWVAAHRVGMVFLIDANFGISPRDVDLVKALASHKHASGFPRHVVVAGFANNNKERTFELTRILRDEGLDEAVTVNFSLQSMSQDALDAIDRQNIPLASYRAESDLYAAHGYELTPDLIFPLPGETLERFREGYADLASWSHVNRIRVYPLAILPNTKLSDPLYREKWGLVTRFERLQTPLLEPERDDLADEWIETVTSTRLIPPEDAARARIFVVVVNAFEIHPLTRGFRRGLSRLHAISAHDFYVRLLRWQADCAGVLAQLLREMEAAFLDAPEQCEDIGWSGRCTCSDGETLMPVKAVTREVLMRAETFRDELRAFVRDALHVAWTDLEEELLRFQTDAWILPEHDPARPPVCRYEVDWPAYLASADGALERRPVVVRYVAREDVLRCGYRPSLDAWQLWYLSPYGHDTFCAYRWEDARVERC